MKRITVGSCQTEWVVSLYTMFGKCFQIFNMYIYNISCFVPFQWQLQRKHKRRKTQARQGWLLRNRQQQQKKLPHRRTVALWHRRHRVRPCPWLQLRHKQQKVWLQQWLHLQLSRVGVTALTEQFILETNIETFYIFINALHAGHRFVLRKVEMLKYFTKIQVLFLSY